MPAKPKSAKRKLSKEKIAKQYQETMRANDAAREFARRKLCSVLLFWKVCGDKQCLRAKACAGNADACFTQLWPQVPENLKFTIRSFIKASGPGRTRQQIEADMARDRQRWRETQASLTRVDAARAQAAPNAPLPQTPAVVRAEPDAPRNPRARVL